MPAVDSVALVLLAFGVLAALSVLLSGASGKLGVPVMLLFLGLGMAAGSEGIGGIAFDDHPLTFRLGTVALVLILFDGGLNTPLGSLRRSIGPAALLATAGVAGTTLILAAGAHLLGFSWGEALLLGAVVSSTDAAAVFSVLRGGGVHVRHRVGATLELESGLNDPMAVILTLALTESLITGQRLGPGLLASVLLHVAVGAAGGVAVGLAGRWILARVRLPAAGLYPVFTIALALLGFAAPTLLHGSGFLAVYLAAVILGNGRLPYRTGLTRVHDAVAWLGQIGMFLLLGLLVFPSELVPVAGEGIAVALLLALVARPVVVLACLLPLGYPVREAVFIAWVGLRGAVPIVLATFPVLAGAPGARHIFNVVFFVVVVSAVLQGSTVRRLARRLGVLADHPPPPPASLEVTSTAVLDGDVTPFYLDRGSPAAGKRLAELSFPEKAAAMLIVRGRELLAARGATTLAEGDHVYVFCAPADREAVDRLFGLPDL